MIKCAEPGCGGEVFFYIVQKVKIRPDDEGKIPEVDVIFDEKGMPTRLSGTPEEIELIGYKAACEFCKTQYIVDRTNE